MLTVAFPAAAFDTNCYVLATGRGQECIVVDPGVGVVDPLREVLAEHRLRPAAVLLTHGHADHTWSATPVCGGEHAAYVHEADRHRLRDPLADLPPVLLGMLAQQFGAVPTWTEPSDVVPVRDAQTLSLAGLSLTVRHAPGHTEGSVLFDLADVPDGLPADVDLRSTVLAGDVLFAGAVGRTDLPGGDVGQMRRSLRDVVLPLPDTALVLPGHGPATTMAHERATNPYLQGLAA